MSDKRKRWNHGNKDGMHLYKSLVSNQELTYKKIAAENKSIVDVYGARTVTDTIVRQKAQLKNFSRRI